MLKQNLRKPSLQHIHVVIADADRPMAELLQKILRELGMSNISLANCGRKALEIIKSQYVDILITEWEMSPLDGINLIKTLRNSENPYFALLPIIMLTARATTDDVIQARDKGVTEFLVKPYTTKTLYRQLEHVIDFPRHFIISHEYTGPDRRRINAAPPKQERRHLKPVDCPTIVKIKKQNGKILRLLPRKELRKKMGIKNSLREIITPQMLAEAQATIDSFQHESLQWIAEDMQKLEHAVQQIITHHDISALNNCKKYLLSIKARAGTFGYTLPAQISYDLYKFLRNNFTIGNLRHNLILQKYVEVIKIIIAKKVIGTGGEIERQLCEGLAELMASAT